MQVTGGFRGSELIRVDIWKLPQMTILAFFLAGPPWMLGLVTRMSLAGSGGDVACPLGTSSYTPSS